MIIDTTYRTSYERRDPDSYDSTLRDYHQLLWSKQLPGGKNFDLSVNPSPPYKLTHTSNIGTFVLSSDSIIHTYTRWKRMSNILDNIPKEERDAFYSLGCTIGGYIIFPSNPVDGKRTINGERGTNRDINDRFDLTLECIRRWYVNESSPLFDCLNRYGDFFELFDNFEGYVEFFLLEDLVDPDTGRIRFWLPFKEFGITGSLPKNVAEYKEYMKNVSHFAKARNARIAEYSKKIESGEPPRSE